MKRVAVLALLACLAAGPAGADGLQAGPAPAAAATAPADGCGRPQAPAFPAPAGAGALSFAQIEHYRTERDDYFSAADTALACLDGQIDAQVRTVFASGEAVSDSLRALGVAHRNLARDRAAAHENFLRLCMAWEDAKLTKLPAGCVPAVEQAKIQN